MKLVKEGRDENVVHKDLQATVSLNVVNRKRDRKCTFKSYDRFTKNKNNNLCLKFLVIPYGRLLFRGGGSKFGSGKFLTLTEKVTDDTETHALNFHIFN